MTDSPPVRKDRNYQEIVVLIGGMGYSLDMRSGIKSFVIGTGSFLLALSAQAAVNPELKDNYQSIVDRNPFGLRPPPPPAAAAPPPEAPKPKVKVYLTGLTSYDGNRAFLKTEEDGKKEEKFYALGPEESQDGITILNIDQQARTVKIRMEGTDTLLSFKTHGVPAPAGAAPLPVAPGARPGLPGIPPPPGQAGAQHNFPSANQGNQNANEAVQRTSNGYNRNSSRRREIPARTMRTQTPGANLNLPGQNGGNPNYPQNGQQNQEPVEQIDPAVQYLNLRAQELRARQENIPFPPVPPIE